jgi:membrane protein
MAPLKDRLTDRVAGVREKRPWIDHVVEAAGYYSRRNGNAHAGAVTFFAFLSFFPLLAMAFFAVGYVSAVAPEARAELVDAIESIFPGLIGPGEDQISLDTFEQYAGASISIALVGLLYAGLAWVSSMRRALGEMFEMPEDDRLGFVPGKVRDLGMLVVLGVVLVLSVSLSGSITWFSEAILRWVGVDGSMAAGVLLWFLGHGLGIAATTLLFMTLYALVPKPLVARGAMWQGALVGAVGFEILKSVAGILIEMTTERPAFQAFGVALILLVWINYFSRLVMLSASWAYTSPAAQEHREAEQAPLVQEHELESIVPAPASVVSEDPEDSPLPQTRRRRRRAGQVGAISAAGLGAVAALTWLGRRRLH